MCSLTTGTSIPLPCGNQTVYCPIGASGPTVVEAGYLALSITTQATQFAVVDCPAGANSTATQNICFAETLFSSGRYHNDKHFASPLVHMGTQ